jgi:hypothetical protein
MMADGLGRRWGVGWIVMSLVDLASEVLSLRSPSVSGSRPSVAWLFQQNRLHVLIVDFSDADVQQFAEADRREVDPPIQVQTATWSKAGTLDWWVKERQEWLGRVRGADGRQRWVRSVDLRPASGSQP